MAKKNKGGRPTKYRAEFCDQLIKHMAEGGSFESFGAVADVGRATLYYWLEHHDAFVEAKDRGEVKSLKFWEDVGRAGCTGVLRRVTKEETKEDSHGNKTVVKSYAPARFNPKPWSLTMKNRFRWAEKVSLDGHLTSYTKNLDNMTLEEIDKELAALKKQNDEE